MNLKNQNASVKPHVKELKRDSNKYKYILLWSGKFYRLINNTLRFYPIETIMAETRYIKFYIIKLVKSFYKYGIYKDDIEKNVPYLYRGLTYDFKIIDSYNEPGFISTSMSKHVAESFAKKNGSILTFKTSHLPSDVPFILIDEKISGRLHEQEILMLPGHINVKKKNDNIKATYEMNKLFLDIVSKSDKVSGGGDREEEYSKNIKLAGKYVVWWRAIKGRDPEIINWMKLPKKKTEVLDFYNEYVIPYDDTFIVKNNFIPEFMDMKKTIFDKADKKQEITKDELELYSSYMVHMAIYDLKKKHVDTLHYGMFPSMFQEINNVDTKPIEALICKTVR
jgi:hypothetical protein